MYKSMIYDEMPRKEFVRLVKMYISEFRLPGHLQFTDDTMGKLDYAVVRYENTLYVTKSAVNSLLKPSDRIVAVDSKSIEETALENEVFLMGEPIERQSFLWPQILMFSDYITVIRENVGQIDIPTLLSKEVVFREEKYYCEIQPDNKIYMRIADFSDDRKIKELLADAHTYLEQCDELTIDVRENAGGSDPAFYPLLEYCFPEGEHYIIESGMEINYSVRNCESRLRIFDEFFGDDVTPELRELIDLSKAELQSQKGKGFVRMPDAKIKISGKKYPVKIKLLTDECCCSAGEYFVELASKSPKVLVVGRPTLGITDYSNCTNAVWEDFYLAYPTLRDCRIDFGKELLGKGVPVDELIEWTPALVRKSE